jgi:hypothetical protein
LESSELYCSIFGFTKSSKIQNQLSIKASAPNYQVASLFRFVFEFIGYRDSAENCIQVEELGGKFLSQISFEFEMLYFSSWASLVNVLAE